MGQEVPKRTEALQNESEVDRLASLLTSSDINELMKTIQADLSELRNKMENQTILTNFHCSTLQKFKGS